MRPPLSYVPALPVALGLSAGIALFRITGYLWVTVAALAIVTLVMMMCNRRGPALVPLYAVMGCFLAYVNQPTVPPEYMLGRQGILTCTISSVNPSFETCMCVIDADTWTDLGDSVTRPARFKVALNIDEAGREFLPGQRVQAVTKLEPLSSTGAIPDQTDFSANLYINGVGARGYIPDGNIAILEYDPTWYQTIATEGRAELSTAIMNIGLSTDAREFMMATMVGDDMYMSETVRDNFRTAGVAHILAISGMHLSILIWFMSLILYGVRCLPSGREIYLLVLIVVSWVYALVVGMTPAISRAAVMVTVFIVGRLLQRRSFAYNSLCITVIVWLIINPYMLFSPGLQLSVVAVAAIIYASDTVRTLGVSRRRQHGLLTVAVPVFAFCAVAPLSAIYFHEVPVWFLLSNLIASVLIVPLFGLGCLLVILSAVGVTVPPLAWLADIIYKGISGSMEIIAGWPGSHVSGLFPGVVEIVCYVLAMASVVMAVNKRRAIYLGVGALWIVVMSLAAQWKTPPPRVEAYLPADNALGLMVLHAQGRVAMVSPSARVDSTTMAWIAEHKYGEFVGRRSADVIEFPRGDFDLGAIALHDDILAIGPKTMQIVDSNMMYTPVHTTYALVTRNFGGDVDEVMSRTDADTILIGRDFNRIRARRLADSLSARHVPYILIQDTTFAIVIQ